MEAFCSARSRTARLPACMVSTWAVRIESSDLVLCGACCKDMDADVASTVFGRLGGRGRRAGRQTDRRVESLHCRDSGGLAEYVMDRG